MQIVVGDPKLPKGNIKQIIKTLRVFLTSAFIQIDINFKVGRLVLQPHLSF